MPITPKERDEIMRLLESRTDCAFRYGVEASPRNFRALASATKSLRTYLNSLTSQERDTAAAIRKETD